MQQKAFFAALGLLAVLTSPTVPANSYKWTDGDGRVHYSDKVPPEAVTWEREVKSKRGVTVGKVEAAKSKEQLRAERAAQVEAEERRRQAEEARRAQKVSDRALLLTFSNAQEIVRARNDRVAAIDSQIGLTKDRLTKLEGQLRKARQQAADSERSGRGNTADMHRRAADLERQVAAYKTSIEKQESERAEIITRFDADLARFRELRGEKAQ